MGLYRVYVPSMILSVILSIAGLITLLPAIGITHWTLYAPVSTVVLIGLAWINCMVRAELKRKTLGR